jgi:hypothetical protein
VAVCGSEKRFSEWSYGSGEEDETKDHKWKDSLPSGSEMSAPVVVFNLFDNSLCF